MGSITLSLPDDLATQLRAHQQQLPTILELGLRELNANAQSGFDGAAAVLELLAALPTPNQILNLRPSPRARIGTDREGSGQPNDIHRRRRVGKIRIPRTPCAHGKSIGKAETSASSAKCLILIPPYAN